MFRTYILVAILAFAAAAALAQPADQWLREYGNEDHDEGWAVCSTADGCFVFAGTSLSPNRLFVQKVDEYGNEHWRRDAIASGDIPEVIHVPSI